MIRQPKTVAREEQAPSFDANAAKARELHGESATKYGVQTQKRDGGLMCSGADWKNT